MSKKVKQYEVRGPGVEVVKVMATDSRDAKRKGAAAIRKITGMDYKDSALTVDCLDGQPAKVPASKPAAKVQTAKSNQIPSINEVVGWVLFYANKGLEWLNGQDK